MAVVSSVTSNFDSLLSTTLYNYRRTLEDQISTSNALLYMLMKRRAGGYEAEAGGGLGAKIVQPLMYALGAGADSYSGYDVLDTTPTDGITAALFDWRQISIPIAINRLEERQNAGEDRMIALLQAKTDQALMGLEEYFAKGLMQGNGPNSATSITTARTSPNNGSSFIDPLPLLVKYDPTSSTVVGNINQNTYSWWRNQYQSFTGLTTFAAFLKLLVHLHNNCSKGPGGQPDLHLVDQNVWETYEAALRSQNRYLDIKSADIPFDNILFRGKPVVWDEFVPDVANGTVTAIPVAASGTWYMLNTKFIKIKYDPETNWMTTPFTKPANQDAKVAHIMWYGASTISNRRKQGVGGLIPTSSIVS